MTFDIDANGILSVSARDKDTGAEQRVTISETTNLDKSEVERMIADAEQHRSEDAKLRTLVDARNELDSIIYQVEKRITELGAGAPAHEKARADSLVADARAAIKDESSVERLRTLTAELQQLHQALGIGSASPGAGASNGSASSNRSPADDDVIDAEFTTQ